MRIDVIEGDHPLETLLYPESYLSLANLFLHYIDAKCNATMLHV